MATATNVLDRARKWIGHTEKPNNRTRFNDKFYGRPVNGSAYPWCAAFTSVICQESGMRPNVDYPHSAGVAVCFAWFQREGRIVSKNRLKPGDMVRFTFSHIGLVEKVLSGGRVQTIKGNTSAGNSGSQRDGGGVHRRIRSLSIIQYGGRPNYTSKPSGDDPGDKEGGLFGMTMYAPRTRKKDLKLPKGKWRTLPIDDKDNTSLLTGLKPGDDVLVHANLGLKGLPKGAEAQVRLYAVSYKKGTKTRRLSAGYAQEIVGTSGNTLGAVTLMRRNTHQAATGRDIRIRAEICVYAKGVTLTRAQFHRGKA